MSMLQRKLFCIFAHQIHQNHFDFVALVYAVMLRAAILRFFKNPFITLVSA